MSRAGIYLRVSTKSQQEEGYGLPAQGVACHTYAEANGLEIVEEYAEAHSGRTSDRPEVQRALADAKDGNFEHLIIARTDRLGRDDLQPVTSILEAAFTEAGVSIHYADEGGEVDLESPSEWLKHGMLKLITGYANKERVLKSMQGKYAAVKEGSIQVGIAPFGYDKRRIGNKSTLVINEVQASYVHQIYEWFNSGSKIYQIVKKLEDARESQGFSFESKFIRGILKSETYAGHWWFGVGEKRVYAEVPAIVSPAEWKTAQVQLAANKRAKAGHTKHNYLLQGRVSCGECGKVYNSKTQGIYAYYQHGTDKDHPKHKDQRNFRREVLESEAKQYIFTLMLDPDSLIAEALGDKTDVDQFTQDRLERVEKRLGALEKQAGSIRRYLREGIYSEADYLVEKQDIEIEQEELRRSALELQQQLEPDDLELEAYEQIIQQQAAGILADVSFTWDDLLFMVELLDIRIEVMPDKVLLSAANSAAVKPVTDQLLFLSMARP